MKLRKTKAGRYDFRDIHIGKLKGVKYEITETLEGDYYVMAYDTKKDLTLNSLWLGLRFTCVELAKEWCEESHDIEKLRNEYFNKR